MIKSKFNNKKYEIVRGHCPDCVFYDRDKKECDYNKAESVIGIESCFHDIGDDFIIREVK